MRFGAHLPVAGFAGERPSPSTLIECAEAADALGYTTLCANDHLQFAVPWTDSLVALGAAAARTKSISLMTTAALLVVRGPAPLGSALVALNHLSGGRLRVGLTPGSTVADYDAVRIPFAERWSRFDADISALRSYLDTAAPATAIPLWVASWGSEAGLRRVARHGDGWLASAYHSTADHFKRCISYLAAQLTRFGKSPDTFPNAIATTYLHLTDDPVEAASVLGMLVSPHQAPSDLRDRSLVGTPADCIHKLQLLQAAGAREVFVWPIRDEVKQLRRFADEVFPHFI
jgi:alkanesulfonate monooxygenase SsuD/methylene tetrahydromethanopterin reductase-like flavin-dependent oxidoreductase (luciferase family)